MRAFEKPKQSAQTLLLDVMMDGRFVCQLKYTGKSMPAFQGGKVVRVYNSEDLERFVYEQRPSLRGKNINVAFSNQRI